MAPQKPAPATVPVAKTFLLNSDTPAALIQVAYEVRADANSTDEDLRKGANTRFKSEGGVTDSTGSPVNDAQGNQVAYKLPGYSWSMQKGKKVVTEIQGRFQMVFTLAIQTTYGPEATANQISGYGRGTTTDDEAAGDTSLGFHESCHRADFLEFLRNNPLPTYKGKTGITEQEFTGAGTTFTRDFAAYFTRMQTVSDDRTDEVGYKRSEYRSKGPRKP